MTNVICIAYQPGSFGSFIGWTIDRFNAARKQYMPRVVDDPLTEDGSSRGYASFCKVKTNSEFVEDLYEARRTDAQHGYQIYAGWPQGIGEDLLWSINRIANNMSTFDKMFVIECTNPTDHIIRYIRNDAMMDRGRWHGMIEANDSDAILKRLRDDIKSGGLPEDYQHSRLCRIRFSDILDGDENKLFDAIFNHIGVGTCDRDLFLSTITKMRSLQEVYMEKMDDIRSGICDTETQEAIYRYLNDD